MSRELPAHIASLLSDSTAPGARHRDASTGSMRDAEGRLTDSAGIPWEGRDLSADGNPLHTFDGDDGRTPPTVLSARRQLIGGQMDEAGFVAALAGQRLFAPVLATGAGNAEEGDKEADISLVSLTAPDGRRAMPVFTSVEALTSWHRQARPVAAETERIMLAALAEDAELVVLDAGSEQVPTELTFVIRRPAVEALAQGQRWRPSYQDPELAEALAVVPEQCPGVTGLRLQAHSGIVTETAEGTRVLGGGQGPELSIGVVVEPGTDAVGLRLALATVQAALNEVELLRRRADSVQVTLAD